MVAGPYTRTTYTGGQTLNLRTVEMLITAERRCGFTLEITQGSYNAGVTQSAGTHDGGGALDVRAVNLFGTQRDKVVLELRRVGFAAWLRTPAQGDWPYHVHSIAVGDHEMSSEAAFQVSEYNAGRNGLANRGPDDGPRQFVGTIYPQELDVSFYGWDQWDAKDKAEFKADLKAWFEAWFDERLGWQKTITDGNDLPRDAQKVLQYTHGRAIGAEQNAKAAQAAAEAAADAADAAKLAAEATLKAVTPTP